MRLQYIRILKSIGTCILFVLMIQAVLFVHSPNTLTRRYTAVQSQVKNVYSILTFDEDQIREYGDRETLKRIVREYQHNGVINDTWINNEYEALEYQYRLSIKRHIVPRKSQISSVKNKGRNSRVHLTAANKDFLPGLVVYWWFDLCFKQTTWERLWHPLIPNFPQRQTITKIAGDLQKKTGNYMRRIHGFLIPNVTGIYEFEVLSRDGIEVLILDTKLSLENYNSRKLKHAVESSGKTVAYFKLTKKEMDEQDSYEAELQMYTVKTYKVFVQAGVLYYLEIFQGGDLSSQYRISWRLENKSNNNHGNIDANNNINNIENNAKHNRDIFHNRYMDYGRNNHNSKNFTLIDEKHLFYTKELLSRSIQSRLYRHSRPTKLFPVSEDERKRNSFYKIPQLEGSWRRILSSNFLCEPVMSKPRKPIKLYDGYKKNVENSMSYPKEVFLFKYRSKLNDVLIDKWEASEIAEGTFQILNTLYNGNLQFDHLVHLQKNNNKEKPHRFNFWPNHVKTQGAAYYFIELDVRMQNDIQNKVYRTSFFVRYSHKNGTCFIPDYQWRENVTINLITPIRNQRVWLEYLIKSLENLQRKVKDYNIKLIIVDSNSKDGNYSSIVEKTTLHHDYIRLTDEKFSKVIALNRGLDRVSDENSIVFIQDLHLQLPLNIFDRIRKLTIQGKTAFSPTLMKLACGEHEQYTLLKDTVWLDDGTGMIAMYKSDFTKIGGFNEKLFGFKWGGEDWEIIDRIVMNDLYVIHQRLPRFYHIHHPKRGMWDIPES